MTPILSTTGGGSVRGFGRRRPVPSGPSGPSGPPTAVSATATVEGLDLAWTNGDAAAQTRIYNGATLLATANAAATTYSVTGLSGATAYTLTVKHFKNSVESAGSNFNSTTTSLAAPNSLSISSTGVYFSAPDVLANITLNWANGDASAQTRIYSGVTLVATANAAATSYSVTDTLGASVSYYVYHYKNSIESPSNSSTSGTAASYGTVALTVGTTSFVTPSTWNNSNNSIECVGGGEAGQNAYANNYGGTSGTGASYANRINQILSGTYSVTVGAGGAPGDSDMRRGANTTFSGPATIRAKGGNSDQSNLGTTTHVGGQPSIGVNWAMGGNGGGGAGGYDDDGNSGASSQGGCNNAAYLDGGAGGSGQPTLYSSTGAGGSGGYGQGGNGDAGNFPGGAGGGGGGSGYADDGHGGPGCFGSEVGGGGAGGAGGNGVIYITWGA